MMKSEGGEQNWECCCCLEWRCAHPQSVKEMREDTTGVLKLKTQQTTMKMKMSTLFGDVFV